MIGLHTEENKISSNDMVHRPTILIVDDERDILDLIEYNLKKEGFSVLTAEDGQEGINIAIEQLPDLILLDIMMPVFNGIEVCEMLRQHQETKSIPIVFLTARSDEKTEITGLDQGADDFLTKPISTVKLVSRIKAILRRYAEKVEEQQIIHIHDLTIDRGRFVVMRQGVEYHLPRKEFELLHYLASRKGKVLDRQTLLNEVWGSNVYVIDRTIDVHIRKIREKLGENYIDTVKGVGYRFKED